jgi:hypothetical protein
VITPFGAGRAVCNHPFGAFSLLSLQTPGIFGAELDTPEADGFIADGDAGIDYHLLKQTQI